MGYSHDQRIARAHELSKTHPAARQVLEFYIGLTQFQKRIFEETSASGETQVESLSGYFPEFLDLLRRIGPDAMVESAARLQDDTAVREILVECWNGALPPEWFFGRALIAPLAESLASRGQVDPNWGGHVCPFCGSWPVAALLRGEGDGGKRSLVCSLCSTEWQFRRILCPNCGEEDKDKLPVYVAQQFENVRVEACDSCKCYIKAIDLTRDGRAVPPVDEMATVPLNIWAEEHGYTKIGPNIAGM